MQRTDYMERKGKISELDRSFDLHFWQAQSTERRFNAAWEMVIHYARVKGLHVRQLRLHLAGMTEAGIVSKLASGRPQDLLDADLLSQSDKN